MKTVMNSVTELGNKYTIHVKYTLKYILIYT